MPKLMTLTLAALTTKEINTWLSKLPVNEKDALLADLVASGNPQESAELQKRAMREIRSEVKCQSKQCRSAGKINARADFLCQDRQKKEAEKRTRKEPSANAKRPIEGKSISNRLPVVRKNSGTKSSGSSPPVNPSATTKLSSQRIQDLHDLCRRCKANQASSQNESTSFSKNTVGRLASLKDCAKQT